MDCHYCKYSVINFSIGLGAAKLGTSFISTGDDKYMALTYTPKPGKQSKVF